MIVAVKFSLITSRSERHGQSAFPNVTTATITSVSKTTAGKEHIERQLIKTFIRHNDNNEYSKSTVDDEAALQLPSLIATILWLPSWQQTLTPPRPVTACRALHLRSHRATKGKQKEHLPADEKKARRTTVQF